MNFFKKNLDKTIELVKANQLISAVIFILIICVIIIFLRRKRKRKLIKKKKKKVKKKKVLKITKALPFYQRYILGKNDDKALKILVDFINTSKKDLGGGIELPITMKQAKVFKKQMIPNTEMSMLHAISNAKDLVAEGVKKVTAKQALRGTKFVKRR
tara:strand:- start:325 stop:795 length:471 start_codon:yes stop_codon:yes gene_type:complete